MPLLIATPPAPCPHVLEDRWLTGDKKPMTKRTSVSRDATPNHSLFLLGSNISNLSGVELEPAGGRSVRIARGLSQTSDINSEFNFLNVNLFG